MSKEQVFAFVRKHSANLQLSSEVCALIAPYFRTHRDGGCAFDSFMSRAEVLAIISEAFNRPVTGIHVFSVRDPFFSSPAMDASIRDHLGNAFAESLFESPPEGVMTSEREFAKLANAQDPDYEMRFEAAGEDPVVVINEYLPHLPAPLDGIPTPRLSMCLALLYAAVMNDAALIKRLTPMARLLTGIIPMRELDDRPSAWFCFVG